jgi:CHAD domain-containing protein
MLDEAERRSASDCARWIAQQGGSVRDLDVFRTEIMAPLCAQLPDETSLRHFAERAEDARRDAAMALIAALDSRAYTERVLALESWIEGEAWRRTANDRRDEPARDFARDVLRRLHRKLTKHGDRIEALDEEGLHTLRIRAKKLRYAAEFFRSLFGDKAAKIYIRALADMQDRLGTLNDGAAARRIVAALAPTDADQAEFARASGAVMGWTACRVSTGLKGLPDAWEAFAKTKTFWK